MHAVIRVVIVVLFFFNSEFYLECNINTEVILFSLLHTGMLCIFPHSGQFANSSSVLYFPYSTLAIVWKIQHTCPFDPPTQSTIQVCLLVSNVGIAWKQTYSPGVHTLLRSTLTCLWNLDKCLGWGLHMSYLASYVLVNTGHGKTCWI